MTDHNLAKLRKTFKVLGWILVILSGLTLMVFLSRSSRGYYWLLVSPLIAIAIYMLAPRSKITRLVFAYFPFANELIRQQEQVDHNIAVVEKMGYTLKSYELCDIDAADGLRDRLINSIPEVNTDAGRLKNCADLVAAHLNSSRPSLPPELLMLLYQDHHSSPPLVLWMQEKKTLISPLAEVLSTSNHLKSRHYEVSYKKNDLEYFLEKLNAFKLDEVKKEIEGLNELWSVIRDYLAFLHEHQIESRQRIPTPKEILRLLKEEERPLDPDDLGKTLRRILLAFGVKAIRSVFRDEQKELINSFSLISLILFLKHKPDLRANFCREAARDENAARITFAYLEFNEDLHTRVKLDDQDFVSLSYLIKNWAGRVAEKEEALDGFEKEIATIQTTLRQGEWITSLPFMIQRTLQKIAQDTESIRSDIKSLMAERPFILESLKRVFGNLKLETVERYLEARTINAYLITFRTPSGSVARLLNCLVSEFKQPALSKIKVEHTIEGARKYNFKQYTDNSRIGVVPKGLSFEEFQQTFQEDFTKVIQNREFLCPKRPPNAEIREEMPFYWDWAGQPLENIEVILHRFGLSGRNYYGFIAEGISTRYAIERIKELFADILDENELLVLINYEKDEPSIIEAVMDGPITELVADQIKLDPLEIKGFRKKVAGKTDVDQQLRVEISKSLGCRTGKELGHHLLLADQRRLEHATVIAGKILRQRLTGIVPEFDDDRSLTIAASYLGTLRALAGLDKPALH